MVKYVADIESSVQTNLWLGLWKLGMPAQIPHVYKMVIFFITVNDNHVLQLSDWCISQHSWKIWYTAVAL